MTKIDYRKLLGRIKEFGMTQAEVADKIGVSRSHFCQQLAGNYSMRQTEMQKIIELLEIPGADIEEYFFSARS